MKLCKILKVSRAAYYKWTKRKLTRHDIENQLLTSQILALYNSVKGIYGYRRITMTLNRQNGTSYNVKRIRRLMKLSNLKSVIRKKRKSYIASTPRITAENILTRDFEANGINEKWLTDVTEFKYGNGQKAYLSAILDLGDRSIVAYTFGRSNNNELVFRNFDLAMQHNSKASPLFHSDRGFQYTSRVFKNKLDQYGCTQSMSRVSRCIDNGPMEGFWGTLKAEMYHLHKFDTYDQLVNAIETYIHFYNYERYQKKLNGLAPMEYRNQSIIVA